MGTGRLSTGQIIAVVGAAALLVAMFLPWIGVSGPSIPAGIPVPQGISSGSTSENIWKGSTLDIYLLIVILVLNVFWCAALPLVEATRLAIGCPLILSMQV